MANNKVTPKGGRERARRSFVVYTDTAAKFSIIARRSGVLSSELLQQVMQQAVDAWEQEHGPIEGTETQPRVDLSKAIAKAHKTPAVKRGRPKGTKTTKQ